MLARPTGWHFDSSRADAAQREAFDRILGNHMLYTGRTGNLRQQHHEKDMTNPFYRYDPDQCILCGRCVEACQNVQVNETLSIGWESTASAGAVGWRGADRQSRAAFPAATASPSAPAMR